jgi:hypothetical protein
VDEDGRLVGIISKRGSPRAGVEGIAFIEPTRFVLGAYQSVSDQALPPPPTEVEQALARVLAALAGTDPDRPTYDPDRLPDVRAIVAQAPTPETAMIGAAHAWNMHLALLEEHRAAQVESLPIEIREDARLLSATAVNLCRRVLQRAPYMRIRYPVLRPILAGNGRPFVPDDP